MTPWSNSSQSTHPTGRMLWKELLVLCPRFESHRRHCVLFLLSTGSTQEDPTQHYRKIVDWDVKNQIKQPKQDTLSSA